MLNMIKMRWLTCLMLGCVAAMISPARAVSTSHWTQGSEADFKAGTLHNVVVTNLGDVKLSHAVKVIQQENPDVTTVNCLAAAGDGTIYAGTGPKGALLAVKDDKVTTIANIDGAINILCLLVDDSGRLFIGTGGEKGKIYRIDKPGDAPKEIFSADGVQYVWAMVETPDNQVYAATGPNGQVFQIKPDDSHAELYKSDENNITAMISDGKDFLYLGTDPDGLVVRLNRQTKDSFILYNASESEIAALAMDDQGNLYAATGEVSDREQTAPPETPEKETGGRPEGNTSGAPIPSNPPAQPPQPPQMPNPNPGEPKPIPKSPQSRLVDPGIFQPAMMDDNPGDQPGPGDGGGDNQPTPTPDTSGAAAHAGPRPAVPPTPAEAKPEGNAIYKIDKDGFVTEVFRDDVVIYSMIAQGNTLLVGTGDDGEIYQVNPAAEETVVLAKVDAKQVMCLLPVPDGRIFMGVANTGGISSMTGGYATSGTYTSAVLDATQTSLFGNLQLHGQLPDGTTLKVSTRSGNVRDSDATGWSAWTSDQDATEYLKVTAPSARFLQYRLTFGTSAADKTPLVDHVDVAYQMPNLPPVIKSIRIGGDDEGTAAAAASAPTATPTAADHTADSDSGKSSGTGTQTITWDASDPNNDAMVYTLYYRREPQGPWILLKDNLKDTSYDWDTRTAADGRYQVKVVASDALANAPGDGKTASRVSDSYLVVNTPPTVGDIAWKITGTDAQISFRAQDLSCAIASADYTLDSHQDWQAIFPVDTIFDSPDESVNFTVKGLSAGQHQVTIRVTDVAGNQALQTILLNVEGNQ
jgi:hypothetical protein